MRPTGSEADPSGAASGGTDTTRTSDGSTTDPSGNGRAATFTDTKPALALAAAPDTAALESPRATRAAATETAPNTAGRREIVRRMRIDKCYHTLHQGTSK